MPRRPTASRAAPRRFDPGHSFPPRSDGPGEERQDIVVTASKRGAPLTGRLGATYDRTVDDGALRIDGWVRYVGPSNLGVGSILAGAGRLCRQCGHRTMGGGRLGPTLGMTNLANSRGNRFALGTPVTTGRAQVTPLRPRTMRIGVDRSF